MSVLLKPTRDRAMLVGHGIFVLAGQGTFEGNIFHIDTLATMNRTEGSIRVNKVNKGISRHNRGGSGTAVTLDDDISDVSELDENCFQVFFRYFQTQL